jgi:hypothetical protein
MCDQCRQKLGVYRLFREGWIPLDFCSLECLVQWVADDRAIQAAMEQAARDVERMYADQSKTPVP